MAAAFQLQGVYDMLLTVQCHTYYKKHVEICRKEVKASVGLASSRVQDLYRAINAADERFGADLYITGSHRQRLRVKNADEFDYNIILTADTNTWSWGGQFYPRYYGFSDEADVDDPATRMNDDLAVVRSSTPLPNPSVGYTIIPRQLFPYRDLCFDKDVIPILVRRRLKMLVRTILKRDARLQEAITIRGNSAGPALTLRICGQDTPDAASEIHVDLSPCFDVPHLWPEGSDWPRKKSIEWLGHDKVRKVKERGILLVPKKNFDWIISFSDAETELVDDIDADNGCRKLCLRILKSLNTYFCRDMKKPVVSSFTLKNIWLWECEDHPHSSDWTDYKLWPRLSGLTRRLKGCLEKWEAPLYFLKEYNTLKGKDDKDYRKLLGHITAFLANPLPYLDRE